MAATELLIAFGGGLASFVSPCVLPLVPAYLSVSTGLSPADLSEGGRNRLRAARGA
ncbi:MAG: cytochrome c biogenesis protein CcdA, partial [Streptomyces sp.]|nr:cytochrome c biogenesis protein CcdA [Streptomyces sp.]